MHRIALVLGLVVAACGSRDGAGAMPAGDAAATSHEVARTTAASVEPEPGEVALLPMLVHGAIDSAGPVVDLGEPQSAAFLMAPFPIIGETLNGDSWASVVARLRIRVPVSLENPPTAIRFRVRHAHARSVVAIVDGLPVRHLALPAAARPTVLTLPVTPDRFRREIAEVELRFIGGPRAASNALNRVVVVRPRQRARTRTRTRGRRVVRVMRAPRVPTLARRAPIARRPGDSIVRPPAAAEIDWVHLVREPEPAPPPARRVTVADVRTSDLTADVQSNGAPRHALTLYAPTSLSVVTVIPANATLRAALSAEGIRGGTGAPVTVTARIRVEADGAPFVELRTAIAPGDAWREVSLDLAPIVGKAARISVSAEEGGDTRLAVADPRIVSHADVAPAPPPPVRRVLMIVLRGARYDRFAPALSPRFTAGGFERMIREGLVARAVAPSPRPISALASAITGLPADVHRMTDFTDTLDDEARTLATELVESGVATAGFSDDRWWEGSGLDRGIGEHGGCPGEIALCRAEAPISRAVEWLVHQHDRRSFALVVTRAGTAPFDPAPDLLAAIEPSAPENALSADQTAQLAARSRRGAISLDPVQLARLGALYDASIAGVDRGLNSAFERLRESSMLDDTAILVVGDRGCALGESGLVGDGPMSLAVISHTVLMLRAPGVPHVRLEETTSVLDAAATVLERLNATVTGGTQGDRAGATSVLVAHGIGLHPRGAITVTSVRGDLGLRFGELLALGRPSGTLALLQPDNDPLGQEDLATQRPIARAFAETVIAAYRSTETGEPARQMYTPSTRALPPAVEAALRNTGWLRR